MVLGIQQIAMTVKSQIEDFKPSIPLIQALRAPGMRNRHWEEVCSMEFSHMYHWDILVIRAGQDACSTEEGIDLLQMFRNGLTEAH